MFLKMQALQRSILERASNGLTNAYQAAILIWVLLTQIRIEL